MRAEGERTLDIIAMGRATIDLYANELGKMEDAGTFSKYVGGSPANTAVAMANLGLKTGYIGKVSNDAFGRYILSYLDGKKVDTSHILVDESGRRTGVTMGEIQKDGSSSCFMYRKDCADLNIRCEELDESYIAGAGMLLISGTSLSHSPARESVFLAIDYAGRHGTKVVLDLDYREDTWDSPEEASVYYHLAACQCDMVVATREEFDVMERLYLPGNASDAASAGYLMDCGVEMVSVKRGKRGSTVYTRNGSCHGGIYPVRVLKTFGAGDAYSGAFLYGFLKGLRMEESLRYAAAAASITISGHSCSESTPTLREVEQFMKEHEYEDRV